MGFKWMTFWECIKGGVQICNILRKKRGFGSIVSYFECALRVGFKCVIRRECIEGRVLMNDILSVHWGWFQLCDYSSQFICYLSTSDGRKFKQLSYRIQLVEGVFRKYARAAQTRSVSGRQASGNTVSRLTERHFLRKLAPKLKNQNLR